MIADNERWLLSYYRYSEQQGANFFGRLTRVVSSELRPDMERHAHDEQVHANWWEEMLVERDQTPAEVTRAYQDAYLEAAGLPANMMEVLALTHVFERRAAGQYALHRGRPRLDPRISQVLDKILIDEGRHLAWVRGALDRMTREFGLAHVEATLRRYTAADAEVYRCTQGELAERFPELTLTRGDQ